MRKLRLIGIGSSLAALIALGLFLNREPSFDSKSRLPKGVYEATSKQEWITVKEETIDFHVNYSINDPPRYVDMGFRYWKIEDGTLTLRPIAATQYFYFKNFRWDGTNIVRRHPDKGTSTIFHYQGGGR